MADAIMTPTGRSIPTTRRVAAAIPAPRPVTGRCTANRCWPPAVDVAPPRFHELDADFGTDVPSIFAGPRF
ncbi:hypothetical protein FLP41_00715 (plasmid) [Paracoccus marcusii]|uniref:hypothetical protein n=1 Tax=Paracoccus marcusii TaxID=59779 RepID=UPI002ED52065|nr:hypothetical protein FLP41_00715 [Paracoccus marcusii]